MIVNVHFLLLNGERLKGLDGKYLDLLEETLAPGSSSGKAKKKRKGWSDEEDFLNLLEILCTSRILEQ